MKMFFFHILSNTKLDFLHIVTFALKNEMIGNHNFYFRFYFLKKMKLVSTVRHINVTK